MDYTFLSPRNDPKIRKERKKEKKEGRNYSANEKSRKVVVGRATGSAIPVDRCQSVARSLKVESPPTRNSVEPR